MRILELSLRNYRVFEELDLELPARVIGIFGPNGAGKSTLVESVAFALYGRARTDKRQIRTHGVLTDGAVRLVFEHGGQHYEVRRTIRGRNHQTEAELFVGDVVLASGVTDVDAELGRLLRMDHKVFRASVFAEQKQLDAFSEYRPGERKAMVLRLLGIRPVDDARAEARARARERKGDAERMAGALPDLDEHRARLEEAEAERAEWEAVAREALTALEEATARAGQAEATFRESDGIRERVDQIGIERKSLLEQADHHRERHDALTARVEAVRGALSALPDLERERAELGDTAERLSTGRRLHEAADEAREREIELDGLLSVDAEAAAAALGKAQRDLEAARRSATRAEAAQETAHGVRAEAREALVRARDADPAQPCPTCGRPLGEDFEEYVAHCRRNVRLAEGKALSADQKAARAAAAVEEAERRHRRAVAEGDEARRAIERRSRIEEQIASLRSRGDRLARAFGGVPVDLDRLEIDAARATELDARLAALVADRTRLADAEADLAAAVEALDDSGRRLAALAEEEGALGFDVEEHERRRKEHTEAQRLLDQARDEERNASDRLKEATSRAGELRAKIDNLTEIAARVSDLRDEARLLDRVSGLLEGFRTFLYGRIMPQVSRDAEALFRELTNHEYEDLRVDEETLAIQIADAGQYFGIERFSGSESDLANLALRVAISHHLSRMAGADVGMMVLDEVLGALDAERKDLFVQTIGRLSGRFHQLFVITHAEQVKDHFPASVEVRKVGRRRSTAALV
jgi:exonuclease SbcC